LPVFVYKNLGLEYFGQVWLIDKAEVWNSRILVCKFIKKIKVLLENSTNECKSKLQVPIEMLSKKSVSK